MAIRLRRQCRRAKLTPIVVSWVKNKKPRVVPQVVVAVYFEIKQVMVSETNISRSVQVYAALFTLCVTLGCFVTPRTRLSAQQQNAPANTPLKRMADGKRWMARNLGVQIMPS